MSTQQPPLVPLSLAIQATPLDSHTYAVNLEPCFCIGTVPNGGYVASTLLRAAHAHLLPRNQPDTVTAHFEFLARTEPGPAIITVEDVKPGRHLSVLHLTLYQRHLLPRAPWFTPGTSRKELVAYITAGSIASERGLSLPTTYLPLSPPVPPVHLPSLHLSQDAHWERMVLPLTTFGDKAPSLRNMEYYTPKTGQAERGRVDMWMRLAGGGGGRFTNAAMAYVADAWVYVIEQYRPEFPGTEPFRFDRAFWYPTVVLNLEVKKALPAEGVEWLFMRAAAKEIRNGRFDVEVVVLDEAGEVVVLCHHVNMIVDAERNLSERSGGREKKL